MRNVSQASITVYHREVGGACNRISRLGPSIRRKSAAPKVKAIFQFTPRHIIFPESQKSERRDVDSFLWWGHMTWSRSDLPLHPCPTLSLVQAGRMRDVKWDITEECKHVWRLRPWSGLTPRRRSHVRQPSLITHSDRRPDVVTNTPRPGQCRGTCVRISSSFLSQADINTP